MDTNSTQSVTAAGELLTDGTEVVMAELRIDVVGPQIRIRVMRGDVVVSEVIRWSMTEARAEMRRWLLANRPDVTGGVQ